MKKHRIDSAPSLAILRQGPFYSDDDIAGIIKAVGKPPPTIAHVNLKRKLEQAVETQATNQFRQNAPSDKAVSDRFQKIGKKLEDALNELGTGPSGGLGNMPSPIRDALMGKLNKGKQLNGQSSTTVLREAINSVVFLKRLTHGLGVTNQDAPAQFGGRAGAKAVDHWITELAGIYHDSWSTKPGVSQSTLTGVYSGPFFRFVDASSRVVGISKGNQALGKRIQRVLQAMDKSN